MVDQYISKSELSKMILVLLGTQHNGFERLLNAIQSNIDKGVITEEEYAPTKAKRQEWRTRINELEEGLNEESSNSPEK